MAANKRTPAQYEHDLQIEAAMYLRGAYQSAIAAKVGVTHQQVSYDLKVLRRRWQKSALVDMDAAKGKELAKIDALERTYWQAWRRSLKETQKTAASQNSRDVGDEENPRQLIVGMSRVEKEQHTGDPRYLAGVMTCIERRCKVLGIDAPQKVDVHDWRDEARKSGVNADELFEQLVKAAVDRASQSGGVGGGAETPQSHDAAA